MEPQPSLTQAHDPTNTSKPLQDTAGFAQVALDSLSAHIAIVDERGIIVSVNQSWRDFAAANPPTLPNAYAPNAYLGANYLDVCDTATGEEAEIAQRMAAALRMVLTGEAQNAALEYPCHAPHEQRWFAARITRFANAGHAHAVIAHENITARVLAEQRLRSNEHALRRSQEIAHIGHWTWGTRTNTVTWSDEMKRIFGLDPATFAGNLDAVMARAIHPDDAERVASLNAAVINEGRTESTEYRVIWPDGSVHYVLATPADTVRDLHGKILLLSGVVQDITEHKLAELALKESESRYRSLFENAHTAMLLIDPRDGALVDANPAAAEYYGWSRADLCKMRIQQINTLPGHAIRGMLDQAQRNTRNHFFVQHRLANGEVREIEAFNGPIEVQGRTLIYSIIHDITERKQAEEALRRSEANLAMAQRLAGLGSWAFDIVTRASTWSTEMYRLLNWNPANEPLNMVRFWELLHPDDRASVQAAYDRIVEDGSPVEVEIRSNPASGSLRTFSCHVEALFDKSGSVRRLVGTMLDITARKQAAQELLTLAEQMAHIVRSVPEGVLLLDPEGRIVLTNPQADAYLHEIGTIGEDRRLARLNGLQLAALLTSPPFGRWHSLQHDGRSYEFIARPVEPDPTPRGWVLVLRDVTEAVSVQQQLQRQERLAAVGQLAAGIAHDFNNIMSVIVMYAEMIGQSVWLDDRDRSRLDVINQQAMRATQMIRQILDFSRRSVIERESLDLLPLLDDQVALLRRTLPEHIELDLVQAAGSYIVKGDPTRIEQAVMNLALNARDAMPNGGQLRISLDHLSVASAKEAPLPNMEPGDYIRLSIADTGTGIPPEHMDHIFEPFFSTKPRSQGTGLGLAQVHGIVAQHGGLIGVTSTPGGATFTIYLPALAVLEPGDAEAYRKQPVTHGSGQTILVVEDDEALRTTLTDALELWNYQVRTATNGVEALELLLAAQSDPDARIDLVLSDVVMPRMGGVALLKAMRREHITTPIVLMTGHPLGEEMEGLRPLGLHRWIAKPPTVQQLAHALAEALQPGAPPLPGA